MNKPHGINFNLSKNEVETLMLLVDQELAKTVEADLWGASHARRLKILYEKLSNLPVIK